MTCPMCQGKCCRDVDSGYHVEHMAAEVYLHACDCADGTWVNPDAQALDEVTAEARRLSTAVDRLEGESLEILAALGLPEDAEHDEVLAHIRTLVQEHAEIRLAIEGRRKRADLDDLLARVEQGARAVERDKVVAWLRRNPGVSRAPEVITAMTPFEVADAIERGEHLKGGNHD